MANSSGGTGGTVDVLYVQLEAQVQGALATIQGALSQVQTQAGQAGNAAGSSLGAGLGQGAQSGLSQLQATLQQTQTQIQQAMQQAGTQGGAALSQGLSSGATNAGQAATQALGQSLGQLQSVASSAATQAGAQLQQGLSNAASQAGTQAAAQINQGLQGAVQGAAQTGQQTGGAFGGGVQSGAQQGVAQAVTGVNNQLSSTAIPATSSGSAAGAGFSSALKAGMAGALTVIAGVVTALAGIGLAGFGVASDVQDSQNRIQSELGVTALEAERLTGKVKEIFGGNTGASIDDVTSTVITLRQQFQGLADNELVKIANGAHVIKDSFGKEIPEVSSAVKTLMDNFGISSSEALDLVTAGFQKGLNKADDFLDTIGEYSTQFANGGMTAEGFFSTLETGLGGAVLGTDKAADLFKEFRVRIQDGSKATSDSLGMLGIDSEKLARQMASGQTSAADAFNLVLKKIRETGDENTKIQAGVGLLGTQYEDLGQKVVDGIDPAKRSLKSLEGATDSLGVRYNNLSSVLEGIKRQTLLALEPIGKELLKLANDAMPTVQRGFDWFKAVLPGIISSATITIKTIISTVQDVFTKAQPYIKALEPVLQSLMEMFKSLWGALKLAWENVARPVLEAVKPLFDSVFQAIVPIVKTALDTIKGILESVSKLLKGDFAGAWNSISSTVDSALNKIADVVKTLVPKVLEWGASIGKGIVDGIKAGLANVGQIIQDAITGESEVAVRTAAKAARDEADRAIAKRGMPKLDAASLNAGIQYKPQAAPTPTRTPTTPGSSLVDRIDGPSGSRMTQGYGVNGQVAAYKNAIVTPTGREAGHNGIDIVVNGGMGAKVVAPFAGKVEVGFNQWYGNFLKIIDGEGKKLVLGHFQKVLVKNGDFVSTGQVVGLQGNTGNTSDKTKGGRGIHVHVGAEDARGITLNPLKTSFTGMTGGTGGGTSTSALERTTTIVPKLTDSISQLLPKAQALTLALERTSKANNPEAWNKAKAALDTFAKSSDNAKLALEWVESRPIGEKVGPAISSLVQKAQSLARALESTNKGTNPEAWNKAKAALDSFARSSDNAKLALEWVESRPMGEKVGPAISSLVPQAKALTEALEQAKKSANPDRINAAGIALKKFGETSSNAAFAVQFVGQATEKSARQIYQESRAVEQYTQNLEGYNRGALNTLRQQEFAAGDFDAVRLIDSALENLTAKEQAAEEKRTGTAKTEAEKRKQTARDEAKTRAGELSKLTIAYGDLREAGEKSAKGGTFDLKAFSADVKKLDSDAKKAGITLAEFGDYRGKIETAGQAFAGISSAVNKAKTDTALYNKLTQDTVGLLGEMDDSSLRFTATQAKLERNTKLLDAVQVEAAKRATAALKEQEVAGTAAADTLRSSAAALSSAKFGDGQLAGIAAIKASFSSLDDALDYYGQKLIGVGGASLESVKQVAPEIGKALELAFPDSFDVSLGFDSQQIQADGAAYAKEISDLIASLGKRGVDGTGGLNEILARAIGEQNKELIDAVKLELNGRIDGPGSVLSESTEDLARVIEPIRKIGEELDTGRGKGERWARNLTDLTGRLQDLGTKGLLSLDPTELEGRTARLIQDVSAALKEKDLPLRPKLALEGLLKQLQDFAAGNPLEIKTTLENRYARDASTLETGSQTPNASRDYRSQNAIGSENTNARPAVNVAPGEEPASMARAAQALSVQVEALKKRFAELQNAALEGVSVDDIRGRTLMLTRAIDAVLRDNALTPRLELNTQDFLQQVKEFQVGNPLEPVEVEVRYVPSKAVPGGLEESQGRPVGTVIGSEDAPTRPTATTTSEAPRSLSTTPDVLIKNLAQSAREGTKSLEELRYEAAKIDGQLGAALKGASSFAEVKRIQAFRDALGTIINPLEDVTEAQDRFTEAQKSGSEALFEAQSYLSKLQGGTGAQPLAEFEQRAQALEGLASSIRKTAQDAKQTVPELVGQLENLAAGIRSSGGIKEAQDALNAQLERGFSVGASILARAGGEWGGVLSGVMEGAATYFKSGKIEDAISSALNGITGLFEGASQTGKQVVGIFVQTVQGVLSSLAKGDWIGAIVAGVSGLVSTVVAIFTGGAESIRKATEKIKGVKDDLNSSFREGFELIDLSSFLKTEDTAAAWESFFGIQNIQVILDEFGINIAKTLTGGVVKGLQDGIKAGLDGSGSILEGLKSGVRAALEAAFVDALIKNAVLQGALGETLSKITVALAAGNFDLASALLDDLPAQLEAVSTQLEPTVTKFGAALDKFYKPSKASTPAATTPSSTAMDYATPEGQNQLAFDQGLKLFADYQAEKLRLAVASNLEAMNKELATTALTEAQKSDIRSKYALKDNQDRFAYTQALQKKEQDAVDAQNQKGLLSRREYADKTLEVTQKSLLEARDLALSVEGLAEEQKASIRRDYLERDLIAQRSHADSLKSIWTDASDSIYKGFRDAFSKGLKDAFSKGSFGTFKNDLKVALGKIIFDAVLGAVLENLLIAQIVKPAIDAFIAALQTPGSSDDNAALNVLNTAVDTAIDKGKEVYDALAPLAKRLGIGPDAGSAQTTGSSGITLSGGWTRELGAELKSALDKLADTLLEITPRWEALFTGLEPITLPGMNLQLDPAQLEAMQPGQFAIPRVRPNTAGLEGQGSGVNGVSVGEFGGYVSEFGRHVKVLGEYLGGSSGLSEVKRRI